MKDDNFSINILLLILKFYKRVFQLSLNGCILKVRVVKKSPVYPGFEGGRCTHVTIYRSYLPLLSFLASHFQEKWFVLFDSVFSK